MPASYLIVGSGVFGASTALHLIRAHPDAAITLLDRDDFNAPTRVAASWDWNKVVRADYRSLLYMRLALEAQHLWRTDPIWQPYYHESGALWISPTFLAKEVLENFAKLGVKADLQSYSVEETKQLYDGLFADADFTEINEVLVNRTSGWAQAREALRSTIAEAVRLGVKYVVGEVATAVFTGEKDKVVLCTGAYTPRLLLDSDPKWTALHAGERIVAAGVTEGVATVGPESPKLDGVPVSINDNPVERGCDVGGLPLTHLNAYKFWGQRVFRNTVQHAASGTEVSMPPDGPNYQQWDVPPALQEDVLWAPKSLYGKRKVIGEVEKYRICWEAFAPSEDFIISPHTACEGLFVATIGSFHGFKFLPVIGKYVVAMLDGTLDEELKQRWAWDRDVPPSDWMRRCFRGELRDYYPSQNGKTIV